MVTMKGEIAVPWMHMERLKNEVAAINYVKNNTSIPVPTIRCAFEDNGRYYVITDIVPGTTMAELSDSQKVTVLEELEGYIATLHAIKSKVMGGFLGDACLPYRVAEAIPHSGPTRFRDAATDEFVLCHNDLSQYNVIVDETTLKINAILDWEYAGFYPKEMDGAFYKRPGPSGALEGEEDDVPYLLRLLEHWRQT
jgi:aminoglycoside phosphotransferase (APT) family kinase protein